MNSGAQTHQSRQTRHHGKLSKFEEIQRLVSQSGSTGTCEKWLNCLKLTWINVEQSTQSLSKENQNKSTSLLVMVLWSEYFFPPGPHRTKVAICHNEKRLPGLMHIAIE